MQTAAESLAAEYVAAGRPFEASSRGYWSTFPIRYRFVNPQGGANPTHAFLVVDANQVATAFDYQQNGQRADGFGGQIPANYAATNLTTARQTIQSEDFAIHKFRLSAVSARIRFPASVVPTGLDPVVLASLEGRVALVDPGSTITPPQCGSPSNLRDVLSESIRPLLSLTAQWMGKNLDPIGLGSHCPDHIARSFLMTAGEPIQQNSYELKEGFVWRRTGSPKDSELVIQAKTEAAVVIPVNLVTFMGASTTRFTPTEGVIDFQLQLDGVGFSYPSAN